MKEWAKSVGRFVWDMVDDFMSDDCPRVAAALSYYSIFSMPPLLGLMALLGSRFVGPEELRAFLTRQVQTFVGVESAGRVVSVVAGAVAPHFSGWTAVLGVVALLFGATGAFFQLQKALNTAWGVQPDPRRGDVRTFLVKRAVALVMVAAFGVLLVFSVAASTAVSILHRAVRGVAPGVLQGWGLTVADTLASLVAVIALFAIVLRFVPDAVVRWRDAIAGSVFTGLLFTGGKMLIAYYLGRSHPGTVYGAAGSLAVAMLWVYYSAIILLLGAEFTEHWACRQGRGVVPQRGAVRVRRKVVLEDGERGGDGHAQNGDPSAM